MREGGSQLMLPKPGKALLGLMIGLLVIWIAFAIALNWRETNAEVFLLFAGNNEGILRGQVWRLFTAPLLHVPSGTISHILTALLGLYFLGSSLESAWGPKRFLRFVLASSLIAYGLQLVVALLLPANVGAKLVPGHWFGAMPVIEAIAIAWAMSFRGQTVRLMFVLPVSSRGLIIFVVVVSVLRLIALSEAPEGLLSPFGGMLAGWLLGGTPATWRRWFLEGKQRRIQRELERERTERRRRVKDSPFEVIEGGGGASDDDDDEPESGRVLH